MSLIGSFFGKDAPDEKYVDDQSMQEDRRDNKFVGPAIDTACAVYDTMFDALRYMIRGRANALSNMDAAVQSLEERCNSIVERYRDILSKLGDSGADFSAGLSFDLVKDAFDILDSNPVLRRYVGEANYWLLWDTLALLSSQGATIDVGVMSNIKGAIKATIYALMSMTNGLMHFESYLGQVTQVWGWLYAKELRLSLTDSICPQVTCEYFYKPVDNGSLPGSANTGLDRINPVPGPKAFAPMPVPVFDYAHSTREDLANFRYGDPSTWTRALTLESRMAFEKAYQYWRSNYTDAASVSGLLSAAASKLAGDASVIGFGGHKDNHPYGTPLRVGHTFAQLYTEKNESFPVSVSDDPLMDAYAGVDSAFEDLLSAMASDDVVNLRDEMFSAQLGDFTEYVGKWIHIGINRSGVMPSPGVQMAFDICYEIVTGLAAFERFIAAIRRLNTAYYQKFKSPYAIGDIGNWGRPYTDSDTWQSPPLKYLVDTFTEMSKEAPLPDLTAILENYSKNEPELGLPYSFYVADPDAHSLEIYEYLAEYLEGAHAGPLYTLVTNSISAGIDIDAEIGRPVDSGRAPLFAAIGIYGDLRGLYRWDYKVVPYEGFRSKYTRIRGSSRIYYDNTDPSKVIFADNLIRVGVLKYIVTCSAADIETVHRGSETYSVHIFPSETCAVSIIPEAESVLGAEFPSFDSLQRVDAVGPAPGYVKYRYDLTTNVIPRWPKYVDPEKWSIMDLIHELWLLADALAPLCGDGGRRRAELSDLLNDLGMSAECPRAASSSGPCFLGQLPGDDGTHITFRFDLMESIATRLRDAIDSVYRARDEILAATRAW